ncbi:MAG TPA: ATP-binding protein [Bacteriovoracaceae bacterium]|nr:ATP-binding protein [Bacteriovoracaceae bacterium]
MIKSKDNQSHKAHQRLRTLYSISKLLSVFTTVEESFTKIIMTASKSFPLLTAVLIENWELEPRTEVWFSADASEETVRKATTNARNAYSYLSGASEASAANFHTVEAPQNELLRNKNTRASLNGNQDNYIVLPLMIDNLPPLGALQFEGASPLDEYDLEFVNALADLISVALDRYYKTKKERELNKEETRGNLDKITDTKEKVEELETERSLREDFVSLLSHDLRTPMTAARMAADMIKRKSHDPLACVSLSARIIENLARADQMIRNLLDANRIRSGEKLPLSIEHFVLSSLIAQTIEELTLVHGNRFIFRPTETVEGFWDEKGIRRIIENLCSNAIKYGSPDAAVYIELRQTQTTVQILVQNFGKVIPEEERISLFKQFRRSDAAQVSGKRGWGIGLTLVRGVAEAHGGNVSVTSDTETGTIFMVSLPKDARPYA